MYTLKIGELLVSGAGEDVQFYDSLGIDPGGNIVILFVMRLCCDNKSQRIMSYWEEPVFHCVELHLCEM